MMDNVTIDGIEFGFFSDAPMVFVFRDPAGLLHYQRWEDLMMSGPLMNPNNGGVMELLARILRELADRVESDDPRQDGFYRLMDINGNAVGQADYFEEGVIE